jgi:hypothetical protein
MLERLIVAEWLRRGPVAGREMRVADEEQLDLGARLVEPAELCEACRPRATRWVVSYRPNTAIHDLRSLPQSVIYLHA